MGAGGDYSNGMARPVEAVDAQTRAWRESPVKAARRLETCARAFAQCARAAEETLEVLAPKAHLNPQAEAGPERQWRWKRKGYILFWAITAALSLLALAAGYFAGFEA